MKINEIFTSLQGEGRNAGHPILFIRLSGCSRACSWCDTKYHTEVNDEMSPKDMAEYIINSGFKRVCFTGGEPLLQIKDIRKVIRLCSGLSEDINFDLESNGDLVKDYRTFDNLIIIFDYIAFSPKVKNVAERLSIFLKRAEKEYVRFYERQLVDIKVVYNGDKIGADMLEFATMIMPFTSYDSKLDKKVAKICWDYCVKNNLKFSPRLQYLVFGKKRGV